MLLLIDNYDSFTYNLFHYLSEVGAEVQVHRNDALTAEQALALKPTGIILSPGPCSPSEAGICLDVIALAAKQSLPLLGVCLGHQAIGQAFGGKVIRAPLPVHGKTDAITHTNSGIFKNIPSPLKATRYHSLIVEKSTLPADLTVTAENAEGLIMGLQHTKLPIHGVQFHPESIVSEHGHAMLKNFVDLAK
ncbi:MAG: aminodeoxychorismate/anthranilate synthase component II [Alphaproteobacteria bacterium]|nr:aminodeoxychorismate/anthranilate synthase component II [Alphaproteobacteria bacterium]